MFVYRVFVYMHYINNGSFYFKGPRDHGAGGPNSKYMATTYIIRLFSSLIINF